MSDHTKSARAKADAEFEKTQSQARQREKARAAQDEQRQSIEDKTALLRQLRLAKEAAERKG